MKNSEEKTKNELANFIETCRKTIKIWVVGFVIAIIGLIILVSVLASDPSAIAPIMSVLGAYVLIILTISACCFYYYFKVWFSPIENNALVSRQKKILIAVVLCEIFLWGTFFIPLITKVFFYFGYKEILKAN